MSLSTAEYQELDHAHFLHPFTDHKRMHETGARIIQRAEGVYLVSLLVLEGKYELQKHRTRINALQIFSA